MDGCHSVLFETARWWIGVSHQIEYKRVSFWAFEKSGPVVFGDYLMFWRVCFCSMISCEVEEVGHPPVRWLFTSFFGVAGFLRCFFNVRIKIVKGATVFSWVSYILGFRVLSMAFKIENAATGDDLIGLKSFFSSGDKNQKLFEHLYTSLRKTADFHLLNGKRRLNWELPTQITVEKIVFAK